MLPGTRIVEDQLCLTEHYEGRVAYNGIQEPVDSRDWHRGVEQLGQGLDLPDFQVVGTDSEEEQVGLVEVGGVTLVAIGEVRLFCIYNFVV